MAVQLATGEEIIAVVRRIAPAIALLAVLAPAVAQAQTNIDQGKSPAQIFAADCQTCHKGARGLANGQNSLTLTSFLTEHYTSSRQQAAALAAFVLGAGGSASGGDTSTQGRGQKPTAERTAAPAPAPATPALGTPGEESKPTVRQARRPTKPEDEVPANAKLQPPSTGVDVKPDAEPKPAEESGAAGAVRRVPPGRHDIGSTTATRGRPKLPEAVPPPPLESTTVVAVPGAVEPPGQEPGATAIPGSSASAPAQEPPGEAAPVPRDNIPD